MKMFLSKRYKSKQSIYIINIRIYTFLHSGADLDIINIIEYLKIYLNV